jgi:hypothetical protein
MVDLMSLDPNSPLHEKLAMRAQNVEYSKRSTRTSACIQ